MNFTIISNNTRYVLDNQEFYKYTKSINIIQNLINNLINNKISEKIIIFVCIILYPILGLLNIDITHIIQDRNNLIIFNICLIFYGCVSYYKIIN